MSSLKFAQFFDKLTSEVAIKDEPLSPLSGSVVLNSPQRLNPSTFKWNNKELKELALESLHYSSKGNSFILSKVLHSLQSDHVQAACFVKEIIRCLFTVNFNDDVLNMVADFIAKDLINGDCDVDYQTSIVVSAVEFIVSFMCNPQNDAVCNGRAVVLLKPLLQFNICAAEDRACEVKFFNQMVKLSTFAVEVVNQVIIETEWDCSQYLLYVAEVMSQISIRSATSDHFIRWIKHLFDKVQKLSTESPEQVSKAVDYLCKLSCRKQLYELLIDELDGLMKNNEMSLGQSEELVHLLARTESTCIALFVDLTRLFPSLGSHLVKSMQRKVPAFNYIHTSRFLFSVYLSCMAPGAACGNQVKENVEDSLRKQILNLCENEQNTAVFIQYKQQLPPVKNVMEYVKECIDLCSHVNGIEKLLEGIVAFGFMLMDNFGPQLGPLQSSSSSSSLQYYAIPCAPLTVRQTVCKLGCDIVELVFVRFDICRSTLLNQTMSKVYIKASAKGAVVSHYSQLFTKLVRIAPVTVFDNIAKLSSWFAYLPLLPVAVFTDIMHGIRPLIKLNSTLRDELLPVLKKAHRSNCSKSREIAALGCLIALRNLKISVDGCGMSSIGDTIPCSISLSQVATDIQMTSSSNNNSGCFELIANLRRCLSQSTSPQAKQLVYMNISTVVADNHSLSCALMELLYQHLLPKWLNSKREATKMFDMCLNDEDSVVENGSEFLSEPLGWLINALGDSFHVINERLSRRSVSDIGRGEDSTLTDICKQGFKLLNELCTSFSSLQLSDLGIDKCAQYTTKTRDGLFNITRAKLAVSVVQALIQFKLTHIRNMSEPESSNIRLIQTLFDLCLEICPLIKDTKIDNVFSLSTLRYLVAVVLFPTLSGEDENDSFCDLRQSPESENLKLYILRLLIGQTQSCLWYNTVDNRFLYESSESFTLECDNFNQLGVFLWKGFTSYLEDPPVNTSNRRGKTLYESMLDCLTLITKVIWARFSGRLQSFFESVLNCGQETRTSRSSSLYYQVVERIEKFIMTATDNQNVSSGTVEQLFRFLIVANDIMFSSRGVLFSREASGTVEVTWELKESCQWLCKMSMELKALDHVSTRLLLSLMLTSCSKIQTCNFATKVASQIYYELSSNSSSQQEVPKTHIVIVTRENAELLANELNSFLTSWLNNIQWFNKVFSRTLLTCAKTNAIDSGGDVLNNFDRMELKLCNEFLAVTYTLIKLVNCPFNRENSFCNTITNCHSYYTYLSFFVKSLVYKLQHVSRNRSGGGCSLISELERLIKNCQAPMKDGLHNAFEHASTSLWKSSEDGGTGSKKKKKTATSANKADNGEASSDIADTRDNSTEEDGQVDISLLEGNEKDKSKVGKETKNIPQLIFAMEQLEKNVFQLCKIVGLDSSQFISSVNLRNFRVRDCENIETNSNTEQVEVGSERVGPPPSRRARTN